ncbi:hypothetical protein A7Q09_05390 [Methylacidiphilum sp. Yel]|nr:hypothetical protein [Methylacidiphilum sp. Yel]TFE69326.1 hypothetical protein A7Q09_05390 [Methylacidiphilum sp. Yel]
MNTGPDYLIRWRSADGLDIKVVLEVKGLEMEQDRQKEVAAGRWVRAVNRHGEFGWWVYVVCKDALQVQSATTKVMPPELDPSQKHATVSKYLP